VIILNIKNIKNYLYFILYLVGLDILISIIYLYTNMSYDTNATLLFIGTIIGIFILSFNNGKKALKRGLLNGLRLGLIITFIFFIISLLNKDYFSISKITYYGILILSSSIGGSLGINFKKQ